MSPHTRLLVAIAATYAFAQSGMLYIAANPDYTPGLAVMLAPYWVAVMLAPCVSYAMDLCTMAMVRRARASRARTRVPRVTGSTKVHQTA